MCHKAELQFTSLSHDESCDRAQLSFRRAEPHIYDHLPPTPPNTTDRTPQSGVDVMGCPEEEDPALVPLWFFHHTHNPDAHILLQLRYETEGEREKNAV